MRTHDSVHPKPVIVATVVNGLIVLFLPLIVSAVITLLPDHMHSGAVGYDPAISPWVRTARDIATFVGILAAMSPLAALAAWRTWVHANEWYAGERRWRGIWEAGMVGFAIVAVPVLLAVAPHLFAQPLVAVGYAFFYGLIGLVVGLGLGLVLQMTALVALIVSEIVTE